MDRDMEAIKKIIIVLKDSDKALVGVVDMPDDVFKFNAMLLIEAGLADGAVKQSSRTSTAVPLAVYLKRLTWDGFEFADLIKDETLWEKAKENVLKPAGSWSFSVLLEWLKREALKSFI